jgi:hypothetical protein
MATLLTRIHADIRLRDEPAPSTSLLPDAWHRDLSPTAPFQVKVKVKVKVTLRQQ